MAIQPYQPESLSPEIESGIFDVHRDARFALAILAIGETVIPGREEEYYGYLRLRANVYADEIGAIPVEEIKADGTESDEDDARAVHFAIIENAITNPRVVSSMRLITKTKELTQPLPIEGFFPESFEEPLPIGSVEVSRYISRHSDPKIQHKLRWPLFAAGSSYILANQLSPTFAVVVPSLEKDLERTRVPFKKIGATKYLDEYFDAHVPIDIDIEGLAKNLGITQHQLEEISEKQLDVTYFDSRPQSGSDQIAA